MKKFYIFLLIFLASLIISCDSKIDEPEITQTQKVGEKVNKLYISSPEEPISVSPNIAVSQTGLLINSFISEGLTKMGKDGDIIPGLAERWEVSEDGKIWKFYLRENLKWSNGDRITANDFRFSWLNVLTPSTNSKNANMMYIIKGAEKYNKGMGKISEVGIKVINRRVLEVELEKPAIYFPMLLTQVVFSPISENFYNGSKEDFGMRPETMLSSGPYVLREWRYGHNLILVKNPNYWDKSKITLEGINVDIIPSSLKNLQTFNNNQLDTIFLSPEQYEVYKNDTRIRKISRPNVYFLSLNQKSDILSNINIRKALQISYDREKLQELIGEQGNTAGGFIPNGIRGYEKDFREEIGDITPKYNLRKAKSLYKKGLNELGLEKSPKLKLFIDRGFLNEKIAKFLQDELKRTLDVELEVIIGKAGEYDMRLTSWEASYEDFLPYLNIFISNNKNNYGNYSNEEYDKKVKEIEILMDNEKRMELIEEAEQLLIDDVPAIFLYFQNQGILVDSKVTNIYFRQFGVKYYLEEIEIK